MAGRAKYRPPISTREAADQINIGLESGDNKALLESLRYVADKVGMTRLAKATGLNREHLYTMLGQKGNPNLDTITRILRGLRLVLRVEPMTADDVSMTQAWELKEATGLIQDSIWDIPDDDEDFPDVVDLDFPEPEKKHEQVIVPVTVNEDELIVPATRLRSAFIGPLTSSEIQTIREMIGWYTDITTEVKETDVK